MPVNGTRHVFTSMGTAVSLVFAGSAPAGATAAVEAAFAALDDQFSLYKPASEASAIARGELPIERATPKMRAAYALAERWTTATKGAFVAHRPDGSIDLSGVIKAQAIHEAGEALTALGALDWCLNAGGDVLTSGRQADGSAWVVGIVDPADRQALLTQFACGPEHSAVATSGTAERGEHVWRPGGDDTMIQVTVAAANIMTADVLATAILAGGRATLDLAMRSFDIEAIACTRRGELLASAAFRQPA